jgi:predicted nicotinamide N-methyase
MTNRTPTRTLVGIFLLASSLLATQVALTRIYSVILWYHFASLAVSLTLLGFAISGVALYVSESLQKRDPDWLMSRSALMFAATSAISVLISGSIETGTVGRLILCSTMVVPFFFAGLCISIALKNRPSDVSRIYFADLLGSSLGCLCVVASLNLLGGRDSVLASAVVASFAAWVLAEDRRKLAPQAGGVAALILFATLLPDTQNSGFGVVSSRHNLDPDTYIGSRWNSFSRVDFYRDDRANFGRGLVLKLDQEDPVPPRILMLIDGWAQTDMLVIHDRPLADLHFLDRTMVGHAMSRMDERKRVLVIGAGGGLDVATALRLGADQVTAVEINPLITDMVVKDNPAESGHIYDRPEVDLVVAEGRHFLEKSDDEFDLILLSGVDTQAATEAGAFALSENYLYTVEAMSAYLEHLSEDGVVVFRRWRYNPPRQTLRLTALAIEALERADESNPADHLVVLGRGANSLTVIKKTPFRSDEIERLTSENDLGVETLFTPSHEMEGSPFEIVAHSDSREAFFSAYPFDVAPTTDDNPFFFEHLKWDQVFKVPRQAISQVSGQLVLVVTLILLLLLLGVFVILPLQMKGAREGLVLRGNFGILGYFYLIGLAFIMIEMALMQKFILFLGRPTYALSVVLFSLLAFSAIGARLTGLWRDSRLLFAVGLTCLAVTVIGIAYTGFVFQALWTFVGYGPIVRVIASVIAIAPIGLVMGMPFPLGIRISGNYEPRLVPWLWAMNGHATVVGAVGAVMLAISFGFRAVTLLALLSYLVAGLSLRRWANAR